MNMMIGELIDFYYGLYKRSQKNQRKDYRKKPGYEIRVDRLESHLKGNGKEEGSHGKAREE